MSASVDNQIRFRAHEPLLDAIQARGYGQSLSAVAYRDLDRYYRLLARSIPKFTVPEANVLLASLAQRQHDPSAADLVWGAVDEAMRRDGVGEQLGVARDEFVARLRDHLTAFEQFAIVDAVERIKRMSVQPKTWRERDVALQHVGLVPDALARAKASWDNLYEAASEAIISTGCQVYAAPGVPKSGTAKLQEAVPLMAERGHIDTATSDRFAQHLRYHDDLIASGRPITTQEAEDFVRVASDLEETFWALVPINDLPGGMTRSVRDPRTQEWKLERLSRKRLVGDAPLRGDEL